jgi:hypothetical protein
LLYKICFTNFITNFNWTREGGKAKTSKNRRIPQLNPRQHTPPYPPFTTPFANIRPPTPQHYLFINAPPRLWSISLSFCKVFIAYVALDLHIYCWKGPPSLFEHICKVGLTIVTLIVNPKIYNELCLYIYRHYYFIF